MIDAIEPLSLVLWGVFFLAAGMYPLGFMLGAPCSPCCEKVCEPLFHRCLRELSVDGSDPAKALYVPSREIFTHAEAAIVKASEKAIISVAISIRSLAAVHLNPGEQLVYSAEIALAGPVSLGEESWRAVIPADANYRSILITLVGRTIDERSPTYQAVVPAVVSGTSVTAYASLQDQVVTLSGIEIDLENTVSSSCTTSTCFIRVKPSGLVKVSGREGSFYPEYFRPAVEGSISNLAMDKWVVNGTVMLDGFQLRELDFDKAEQFRDGEIALRKQRKYSKYVPADAAVGGVGRFVEVTDYVDVKLVEYSPLCAMPLCYSNGVETTVPEDLLPTGVTYTPAVGEKYGCKDGYEFVLGPASACNYSHATNECNGFVSKSIGLLEFWRQYSLDPVANGRSTMGGWSYYCAPDILTWMEYTPTPLVKYGATYTVGGTYNQAAGRYGKCLSGGVAYLPDINGTCHPAEVSIDVGSMSEPVFYYFLRPTSLPAATSIVKDRLSAFEGTHVLAPGSQSDIGCTGMTYGLTVQGTVVNDVDAYGQNRTRSDYVSLQLRYHTGYSSQTYLGGMFTPLGCGRNSSFDMLTIGGAIFIARQASGFPESVYGELLSIGARWFSGNVPDTWKNSYSTSFPGFEVPFGTLGGSGYWNVVGMQAGFEPQQYLLLSTSTVSMSEGEPMPTCSGVSYTPTEVTIDNTALVDRRTYGYIYSYIWGNAPGATLTATTSPTGNYQLCGGATTTFDSFNNDRSQDRVYTRYAYSDGSDPTAITVTVKGTCIAYPVGLYEGQANQLPNSGYYTIAWYGLHFSYPNDFVNGGCVMLPIKTNGTECEWEVASNDDWLTLAEDTDTGTGDGGVNILIAAMPSGSYEREGSLSLSYNSKTTTIRVRQGGQRFG
jgi:Putative binding domain, N-terminal